MTPTIPMITPLPTWDERADLRFFAFYIGNGTLFLPYERADDEVDYLDDLVDPGPRLGQIFSIIAHAHAAARRGQPRGELGPSSRATAWYRQTFRPDHPVHPPVAAHELVPGDGLAWPDAVARFAADLGAGTLEPALLADHPYVSILTCDGTGAGSTLELIFAIFANVLALTGDEAQARRRAAQHVRSIVDDGYEPEPELSEDETVLCF